MASQPAIGSLGEVVFQVSASIVLTYRQLSRRTRAVYADHEVANGKPASEFTGMDLDDVELTMVLNATLGVRPDEVVDRLREMTESGAAYQLIVGSKPWGYFTLREVGEAIEHTLRSGIVVSAVDVALREYDEKLPNTGNSAAKRDETMRSVTGRGGPKKVPGAKEPLQERELTPAR